MLCDCSRSVSSYVLDAPEEAVNLLQGLTVVLHLVIFDRVERQRSQRRVLETVVVVVGCVVEISSNFQRCEVLVDVGGSVASVARKRSGLSANGVTAAVAQELIRELGLIQRRNGLVLVVEDWRVEAGVGSQSELYKVGELDGLTWIDRLHCCSRAGWGTQRSTWRRLPR